MNIVEQVKVGTILTPDNFATCGIFDVMQSGLTCLCSNGKSCRFAKGIYDIPLLLYNKQDGTLRNPFQNDISLTTAQRDNAGVIPTSAYTFNKLRLFTQVLIYII